MIKRLNKKGASETSGIPIWLIVTLIAAVLVILFVSGAFGTFGDIFSRVKSMEIMAQSCNQYAVQELRTSYCNSFDEVKIAGKRQWANCDWLAKNKYIVIENTLDDCGDDLAINYCQQLKNTDDYNPKTIVNGLPCYIEGGKVNETHWGIAPTIQNK